MRRKALMTLRCLIDWPDGAQQFYKNNVSGSGCATRCPLYPCTMTPFPHLMVPLTLTHKPSINRIPAAKKMLPPFQVCSGDYVPAASHRVVIGR